MGKLTLAFKAFFRVLQDNTFADLATSHMSKTSSTSSRLPKSSEALQLLALLQEEGRWIDFLQEDINDYEDEQVGAAVRDIHSKSRKVLEQYFEIVPVLLGEEESDTTIEEGFDPAEIKLVGKVTGKPPFQGILKHHGWRVEKVNLPQEKRDFSILIPAEVELS